MPPCPSSRLSWYLPNIDPALAAATTPPLMHPTSSIRRACTMCADKPRPCGTRLALMRRGFVAQIGRYSIGYGLGIFCASVRAFDLNRVAGVFHVSGFDKDRGVLR